MRNFKIHNIVTIVISIYSIIYIIAANASVYNIRLNQK